MTKSNLKNQISKIRGFTLIELLVVVTLMSILTLSSVSVFFSYTRSQSFQTGAADVVALLNKAKSRAISQVKPGDKCGIEKLDGYQFSHPLEGASYELSVKCGNGYFLLEKKDLPSQVTFATDSKNVVFFDASTAVVSSPGDIILTSNGNIKIITVDSVGNISVK